MIKKLLVVIAILVSAISVKAQSSVGDWKLHPNFDYYFKKLLILLCISIVITITDFKKEFCSTVVHSQNVHNNCVFCDLICHNFIPFCLFS